MAGPAWAGAAAAWGLGPHRLLLRCGRERLSGRRCRRPGQEPDQRLPAACGKRTPGSEPGRFQMVRRRSTVRFRKGAPGQRQDSKDPNKLVGPRVGPTGFTFASVPGRHRPTPRNSCPPESVNVQSGPGDLVPLRDQDRAGSQSYASQPSFAETGVLSSRVRTGRRRSG
jgi:hypothetical protein